MYAVTGQENSEDYVPLEIAIGAAVEEIEMAKGRDGEMTGVPTGFKELDDLTNGLHAGQMIVVAARPAMGKALALDTPLPTPTGWTTMGAVRVGDELLDAQGRPTRIVAATETMTDHEVYEVEFSDGSVIVADAQHQWLTETRARRKSRWAAENRYNRAKNQRIFPSVVTTEEIAETVTVGAEQRANHAVLNAEPLDLPARTLPVAPYMFGAWLGDGHAAGTRITSETPEIPAYIEREGYSVAARGGMLYSVGLAESPRHEGGRCRTCAQPRPRTGRTAVPAYDDPRHADGAVAHARCARRQAHSGRISALVAAPAPRAARGADGYRWHGRERRRLVPVRRDDKRLADDASELVVSLGIQVRTHVEARARPQRADVELLHR